MFYPLDRSIPHSIRLHWHGLCVTWKKEDVQQQEHLSQENGIDTHKCLKCLNSNTSIWKAIDWATNAVWITISSIYYCFSPGCDDEEREQLQNGELPKPLRCLLSLILNSPIYILSTHAELRKSIWFSHCSSSGLWNKITCTSCCTFDRYFHCRITQQSYCRPAIVSLANRFGWDRVDVGINIRTVFIRHSLQFNFDLACSP